MYMEFCIEMEKVEERTKENVFVMDVYIIETLGLV